MATPYIVQKLIDEPTWRPYCLRCSRMERMRRINDTFACPCGNVVGLDLMTIPSFKVAGAGPCRVCPSGTVPLDDNGMCADCWKAFREWQEHDCGECPGCFQCWQATGATLCMRTCKHAIDNWVP